MAPKIHFGDNALLIHVQDSHILVGNGPSFMEVEIAATVKPDGKEEKITLQGVVIHKKKEGAIIQLADAVIGYIHDTVKTKDAKKYESDVLILTKPQEQLITKLKPKLAVIMNSTVYTARELNKKINTQIIAAQHGTTIDLSDYNALSKQKPLSKFTT
jgi:hypothetical protein